MRILRTALAVLVLGLIAGGSTAAGQASSTGTISAFEADADVYAVGGIALVTEAVGLPIEVYGTRARAAMDSGPRATALAGPVDVPLGAAFGLLGIPVELPTSCQAFYPGTPTVDCGAVPGDAPGSIVGVGSGHAEATGEPDEITSVKASATAASSSVTSTLYRLGAGQSTASTDVDDGRLVARAAVKAGDLRLAGGALQINQVSSYARAESTGERDGAVAAAELAVTDGSLAGVVPFTVNDAGIMFRFPGVPPVPVVGVTLPVPPGDQTIPGPVASALRQALAPVAAQLTPLGIEMKVIPGDETISDDGTTTHALSAALQVTYRLPNSANRVTVEVGRARASAYMTLESESTALNDAVTPSPVVGEDGGTGIETGLAVDAGSTPLADAGDRAAASTALDSGGAQPTELAKPITALDGELVGRARNAYLATLIALAVIGAGFMAFGPVTRTMFSDARRSQPNGSS